MKNIVNNNSDFLFLYDAAACNPNGDPDMENKPRMDYDTDTNLVTDVRLKRYIRDYFKMNGTPIFVDMEGENKVSPDTKLERVIERLLSDENYAEELFNGEEALYEEFKAIISKKKNSDTIVKALQQNKNLKVNFHILGKLVKNEFIDIRLFGSAFAVGGFTKSYIGPVQINWGYSLNKVKFMESNSIVTIMNDDNSTFGKDHRVQYSLIAFTGTINRHAAKSTELTEADLEQFRTSIWESIPALPTRSKQNQFPKLYVEIVYNEGFNNGHFGDLRQLIKTEPKEGDYKKVKSYNDLTVDFSALIELLRANKGEGKAIKEIKVKTNADIKMEV